jgi:hypothetical protein
MERDRPSSHEELVRRLDSMRPDGTFERPLEPKDVTGVLQLALERVRLAEEQTTLALQESTDRLLLETAATRDLVRSLTNPPSRK